MLTRAYTGPQTATLEARGTPASGSDSGGTPDRAAVATLSRVLLSVDKALMYAASLDIGPADDPDLDYISKVRTLFS